MVCDSPISLALSTAWPDSVCCRLDDLPCDAGTLASRILSPGERAHWESMRAVEKRRREWLMGRAVAKEAVRLLLERDLHLLLSPNEIEIQPDSYGCPLVNLVGQAPPPARGSQPRRCVLSIAHSDGTAVALASLAPDTLVGVDLEGVSRRREDFEAIAFSADERALIAALPPELRDEWALRLWSAKEAVGKAIGRGLTAGLEAFHITRMDPSSGMVTVDLQEAALAQCPRLRGKSLNVYTARESNFVFSAMIYQHGVVRMRPSRQEILDYLLQKMGELTQDWDYNDPVGPESKLFTELGFESLDAVVLCTAIQEHYQTPMPFAELLAEIGEQQRDLSIDELTDFVNAHLGAADGTRRVQ